MSLYCYNKGCNKKFNQEENGEEVCRYHPGAPIFHDAHKRWSCCKKGSVDFTEFLNIAGCSVGRHNSEKPAPVAPPEKNPDVEKKIMIVKAPMPLDSNDLANRPSSDAPTVLLQTNIDGKLFQALNVKLAEMSLKSSTNDSDTQINDNVKMDDACQNKSCTAKYKGPLSNSEICYFHPGIPVFHEGLKYWSCCTRKTTEFDSFLSQEGCTQGAHNWKKPTVVIQPCRIDYHQGFAGHVTLDLYAKLAMPDLCEVRANAVRLSVKLVYEAGQAEFSREWNLHGVIIPEQSTVHFRGTKLEICLKKRDAEQWPSLELKNVPLSK